MSNRHHLRRLERHRTGGTRNRMELSMPFPQSPRGMVSRLCPNDECTPRLFQLDPSPRKEVTDEGSLSLTRRKAGEEGMTCPYCGEDAEDDDFTPPDDLEATKEQLGWMAREDIADIFEDMLSDLARRSKHLSYKKSRRRSTPPRFYREDLLRHLTCDICARRYGVYAIGLFCPDCGARNVHVHFQREVQLVTQQISLAQQADEDNRELAYRLLGNAHEDVLTALETYLKAIYRFLVNYRRPEDADELLKGRLIFQNIERAQRYFKKIRVDPYGALGDEDLDMLWLYIQKRHVIGHNLSLVDDFYTDKDETEESGQTVSLLSDDITQFAQLASRVVKHLETSCPEFLPSSNG